MDKKKERSRSGNNSKKKQLSTQFNTLVRISCLEYRFVWPKYIHTFIHHNKENFNSYKHTDSESTYAPQIAFVLALSAEYYTVYKCYCNSPGSIQIGAEFIKFLNS